MIRSYKIKSFQNKKKENKILLLLNEYRKTSNIIASHQWKNFFINSKFDKNLKIIKGNIKTELSARYIQTCQYQIVATLQSFLSNLKNRFEEIVKKSSLNIETKNSLFYINKFNLWLSKSCKMPLEHLKIAHSIFKNILKKFKKPSFKNINMNLDFKVATRTLPKNPNCEFDYWINLSSLENRKLIHIPLKTNKYFKSIQGEIKNFCQINVNKNNEISINLIKEIPNQKETYKKEIKVKKIGIDIGLINLVSTSEGDLFGRNIFKKLKHFDSILQNLTKGLNRRKQNLSENKRYIKLVKRIKNYLKNELNRIFNKIIEFYNPKEIVVEKLNFQNSKLSKRMNRILSNFGLGKINEKLNSLNEEYGIKVTYINPSYTSQTCSNCGYVDKENRKSQESFKCLCCGTKINADINAARNILVRSSYQVSSVQGDLEIVEPIGLYSRSKSVLYYLKIIHRNLIIERFPSLYSWAKVLDKRNFTFI